MKYKIGVNIIFEDRTEEKCIEGDDVNDVLNRVVEVQFSNIRYRIGDLVIQESDPKKKIDFKKEIAKTTSENLKKKIESEIDLLNKSIPNSKNDFWNFLISDFYKNNPEPIKPELPRAPELIKTPPAPDTNAAMYQPKFRLIDKLFTARKKEIIYGYRQMYNEEYEKWLKEKSRIEQLNSVNQGEHVAKVNRLMREYEEKIANWDRKRDVSYQNQKRLKESYENGKTEGAEKYFEIVLKSSEYETELFDKKIFTKYFPETKILFVEYFLPDKKNLTQVKEVKYIASRDEFQEVLFSENELNKKYEDTIYQITLRTLFEVFQSDYHRIINQVIFNGFVDTTNSSTGQQIKPCIISIAVTKEKFLSLNLKDVDPKQCFKGLKGISASKLHTMTPIPPIMKIDKNDKRFIDSYSVTYGIDEGTNIAAMDWEDFEHLIREIFEKEFSENGGEVRVTQASRDGGVDAIVFDLDPIRGGKIVIQAKRYTNVVSVAAVRDLYGTVVNEGATKGILVTTSSYGPDAYEFAKGKPITLLNGANLLHLLEKHGHKAKIDIQEAKKIFLEKENEKMK